MVVGDAEVGCKIVNAHLMSGTRVQVSGACVWPDSMGRSFFGWNVAYEWWITIASMGGQKKQYTGIQARPMRISDRGLNQQIEISIIAKMDKVIDLPLVSMYRTGCMRGFPIQVKLSAAVFEYRGTAAIPLELAYLEKYKTKA